jgi:uncharacterized membrane-anchored protein
MRFPSRQSAVEDLPGLSGTVRLDRRTASLVPRLRPGDIAVIDQLDLDRAGAEALLSCGVAAVVDAAPMVSGRYPNLGPDLLARAGVVLVDDVGSDVFGRLRDGTRVRVHQGELLLDREVVASGRALDPERLSALLEEARTGLSAQLQSFTHNTTEFLRREQELLLHGRGLPELRTRIDGRPVVVVTRGYDYREDLRRLRRFIREQRPVLLGVDAGADALLEAGHRPDILVVGPEGLDQGSAAGGRGTTVSDRALRSAREVVLHADTSGHAGGADRLSRLGVQHRTIAASGTTEDVSLILGDVRGASLLVAVGSHATLEEFLDRQHSGLASTFLTRLRVGPKLVDARGVPQLYSGRVRLWQLLLVLLAGLVALGVALGATPVGQDWWSSVSASLSDVPDWIQGLVS